MSALARRQEVHDIDLLCKYVEASDWTRAAKELAAGVNPNTVSAGSGLTPLQIAVQEDDVLMARLLVEGGADPDFAERGLSPARDAILHKKSEFSFLFGD